MMDGTIRVRSVAWVATAVVLTLVCTLLVTQAWSVGAAPGDDDSTFVPTAGCRMVDTRPAPLTVGPRSTPLGAGDIYTVTVRGSNGECTGGLAIPSDAVAVALNVTATGATAASDIRLYPANLTEVPLLSNLNVTAGAPPTPNKVDVQLSPDGKIKVYNFNGSVNVILDVVGYYTNSTLKELSQRVASLEAAEAAGVDPALLARIDALETGVATNASGIATNASGITALDAAQPFTKFAASSSSSELTTTPTGYLTVTVTAPVAGQVALSAVTVPEHTATGGDVLCVIAEDDAIPTNLLTLIAGGTWFESSGTTASDIGSLTPVAAFDIAAGETVNYVLACEESGGDGRILGRVMTAIFTPAP